ncbi:TPA: hypothetical protein ACX3MK_003015 [Raoultella ornithinolytica]
MMMPNLPEQPAWESGVHQLEESDRAKAGPGGVLNIPPTQLANRTRWLKAQLESISDYREYTFFKTESDPDGTIAGLQGTPSGKLFRVSQGEGDELSFKYFLNDNGTAVPDTVMIGQGSISNAIRLYSNSEKAINDVSVGNIPDGGDCWIKNPSDSTVSEEYTNLAGTLTPTGRKMPTQEYIDQKIASIQSEIDEVIGISSSLRPLVQSSEFIEVGKAGTQHEYVTDIYILTDKDKNIIRCIRDGKMMFFVPTWSKEVTGDKLIIAGVDIDPNGIPPAVLSTSLLGLAKASTYLDPSVFADGGQHEAIKDQDILLDQNYNILRCIRDGVQKYFLPVDTRSLSAQKFELKDAFEFTDSSLFSSGGRLEQWAVAGYEDIVCDKDGNILNYLKDSLRHHLIPHKFKSVDTDTLMVKGVDISESINSGTSNLLPYVQTVGGKSQVFALNKETSALVQITDGTANETNPSIDGAGLLTWESDRDDDVPGGRYFLDKSDIIRPLISRNILVGWGDSFMEQPVMMNKLHELTGLTTYNFGKSGLRSTAVAARQGGAPFYCMPDGGVIPASGSVNLLPNLPGPAASASNGAMTGIKCNLGGVDGTFNWSGTQAYFTRDVAGEAASVPALLPLFVYPYTTSSVVGSVAAGTRYDLHDEAILLLTCGRNNTTLWWEPINDLKSMVGYLKPRGIRFAYMPQFTQASEIRGTDGYQRIHRINQEARDLCPENYVQIDDVDLLQNFKNHHNPASAQDVADIENDTTPTSLRTDALHPSQVLKSDALYIGAEVNAEFNYQFFKNKGWVL